MKIWVIGRNYPTKQNKMCGSFELEQAQMLARRGHEVSYIICPFHPLYKAKKWGAADWQDGDLHVYAYSQLYFPQRMNIYWDSFKKTIWKKLLQRVEEEQGTPEIIHLHYPTMISVPEPIIDYKKKGTRIIATEHWTNVLTGKLTKHARRQLTKYVESSDHFICVGGPLRDNVIRLTNANKPIAVIPNIVSEAFNNPPMEHVGFRFVSLGRLVKIKQFDRMIESFGKTFSGDKSVSLTIAGGGPESGRLKKLIHDLGIEDQVQLIGTKPKNEIASLLAGADALVSYSRLETFGVPVIEGWYCGLPAVATTAIGFAEYWKAYLGELIPFDNDEMLSVTLKRMRNDYSKYDKDVIKAFAREHFSENAVYAQLIDLYKH